MLERFFNGDTSRAEETALEQYFLTTADLPEQYRPYREMFGWYASGMEEEALPSAPALRPKKGWKKAAWGISIAAAVAFMVFLPGGRRNAIAADLSRYEGSFAMRDGEIMPLSADLLPEFEAVMVEASCLEQDIDARMSVLTDDGNSLYPYEIY